MRVRPVWIVLVLLILPPVALIAGWTTFPNAGTTDQCSSLPRIVPQEADAVAFSSMLRSEILDNAGGPFRLQVTDRELTSYVAVNIQGRQLADPQIHFLNDTVCLRGHLVGLGLLKPRLRIEARPYLAAGNVQVDVRHLIVNERLLPAWARRLAQRVTNESIRDAALPIRIDHLDVRDGELAIAGDRLPN